MSTRTRQAKIDRQQVAHLVHQGWTTEDIARHLEAHPSTISRIRTELGIGIPPKKMTPDRLNKLETMLDDGWSFKEIHRTEGVDMETLRRYFPGRQWTKEQTIEYLRLRRMENPKHFNARPKTYDASKYEGNQNSHSTARNAANPSVRLHVHKEH